MITVIGSLNLDLVVKTKRIPRAGETVMGSDFKQVPGGKGGNQADAIAKLGGKVNMIGCVGDDNMGEFLKSSLIKDGVNTDNVLVKQGISTGIASIVVEDSGNNAITVAPGANYELTKDDVIKCQKVIQESSVVLLQLETRLEPIITGLMEAKAAGCTTILNPAPAIKLDDEFYKYIDIITPNETELEILAEKELIDERDILAAAKSLMDRGISHVIVTLGDKGCIYLNADITQKYDAYKVKAIDTTGAGDSFNGALALCLDQGESIQDAISFAMKVGAITVTREGAQTSIPNKREVDRFEEWYSTNKMGVMKL